MFVALSVHASRRGPRALRDGTARVCQLPIVLDSLFPWNEGLEL